MFPNNPREGDRLRFRGGRWEIDVRTEWDDWQWIGTGVNPPGSASPATLTDLGSGEWWYVFTNNNYMVFPNQQLTHRYAEGTVLVPHIHWKPTNSATYTGTWTMVFNSHLNIATGTPADTPITATVAFNSAMTSGQIQTADFNAVLTGIGRRVSSCATVQLSLALTSGAGCALCGFDAHVEVDSRGSRNILSKR
jgi:hypothetical protein